MRMIATDLDGTLLGPTGVVSERNIAALRAARAAGIQIVLATGRPPFMATAVLEQLGDIVGHGVLANGSLVCEYPSGTALRTIRLDIDRAVAAIEHLRRMDATLGFALATDAGFAHEPGFAERMPAAQPGPPVADVLEVVRNGTVALKVMAFSSAATAHELLRSLPPLLPGDIGVTHMGADCVEIGPTGIDKGSALSWLCAQLGVDAAGVVAFGDEFNDHEMLHWAGHAVVMGNASPETKAFASEIAPSNADDGVAVVIEALLASRWR